MNTQSKLSLTENKTSCLSLSDRDTHDTHDTQHRRGNNIKNNETTSTNFGKFRDTSKRVKQEYISRNRDSYKNVYQVANIPLLIFDLILLPIIIIRMILIYFWGSKYNLKGFQFLDVIMHADNPYFNQEDCRLIDTIGKDYRIVIRDDSRIFPLDIVNHVSVECKTEQLVEASGEKSIITSSLNTVNTIPSILKILQDENVVDHETNNHKPMALLNTESKSMSNQMSKLDNEKIGEILQNKSKVDLASGDKKEKLYEDKNSSKKKKRKKSKDIGPESSVLDSSESESTDSESTESESSELETENVEFSEHEEIEKSNNDIYSDGLSESELCDKNPIFVQKTTNQSRSKKTKVKGVNYFESNDDVIKKRYDILDSIKEELNSAFDP